jgi:hypothetical protein
MKSLFSVVFVILFVSCGTNVKKEVDDKTNKTISDSSKYHIDESIYDCMEDSLVKKVLKNGRKDMQVRELIPKPNISFSSGYSDNFSFTQYRFSYKGNNLEFVDTAYEKNRGKIDKRNTYLDGVRLDVCSIKNNTFVVDSVEMNIVYTESEIYTFVNNPSCLLIVSHPMNWVGTMTRFSFFQLINSKQKTVIEFIREEE